MTGEGAPTSEHSWRRLSKSYISALVLHNIFPGPFQWGHADRIASSQLRKKGQCTFGRAVVLSQSRAKKEENQKWLRSLEKHP